MDLLQTVLPRIKRYVRNMLMSSFRLLIGIRLIPYFGVARAACLLNSQKNQGLSQHHWQFRVSPFWRKRPSLGEVLLTYTGLSIMVKKLRWNGCVFFNVVKNAMKSIEFVSWYIFNGTYIWLVFQRPSAKKLLFGSLFDIHTSFPSLASILTHSHHICVWFPLGCSMAQLYGTCQKTGAPT